MNETTKTPETVETTVAMTPQALAHLGQGHVAYVRPILSDDLNRLFPQAPALQPGLNLFALLGADGTPIMVTDNKAAAIANAWEHELTPVSVY